MNPARTWRAAALAAQACLALAVAMHGSAGILAALPLLVLLVAMARGVGRAFAANTLLLPFYCGWFLAFPGHPEAALAAFAFITCMFAARLAHRRRSLAPSP